MAGRKKIIFHEMPQGGGDEQGDGDEHAQGRTDRTYIRRGQTPRPFPKDCSYHRAHLREVTERAHNIDWFFDVLVRVLRVYVPHSIP